MVRYFDEHGEFVLPEEENRGIAIEVLNLMGEGIDSGAMVFIPGSEAWGPAPITAYREGRLVGGIMPDWYSDHILKPQAEDMAGQWRIAPMPSWDDGGGHKTYCVGAARASPSPRRTKTRSMPGSCCSTLM